MSIISSLIERAFLRSSEVWALNVLSVADLTPHTKRVVFSGKNLARFDTNENLHVRLVLPPAGRDRQSWAQVDGEGRLTAEGPPPVYRKYTIRSVDPDQLAVDFVVHEAAGPGSDWAKAAQPGDLVGVIGPGGRAIDSADWYLIAGDEAALPAIGRIAEILPRSAAGSVFVEVDGPAEEQALDLPPQMSLTWLHRSGKPAGSTSLLVNAIANTAWPESSANAFAWVATEAKIAKRIRTYLKTERKLDKTRQLVVAYWTKT